MRDRPHARAWDLITAAVLVLVSAAICRPLFFADYINQMGSGDGPLIAMARYTAANWRDLAWWPLWFGGMPLQNVYGPLAHFPLALLSTVLHHSPAWTLHTMGALLYCLGPLALWWMALQLGGSRTWAVASALLFAVTSPAAVLIRSIRSDVGGPFHLRRLYDMAVYGEYPHVALLSLSPLVLVLFARMVRSRSPAWIAAAALVLACFAASSVTASVGFALIAIAWVVALPASEYRAAVLRLGAAAVLAYGLAMPWIPPSTIRLIAFNAQWGTGRPTPFTPRHILYFALIAAGTAAFRILLARVRAHELLRFSLLLIFFCGAIMLPDLAGGAAIVPQPYRFQLEFELGCVLALGFLWWKTAGSLRPGIQAALAGALVLALVMHNAAHTSRYMRKIDIRRTAEYQSAMWFDRNMHGGRVFAPGSVSFWMNVFTDTPQLGGCCDQGVPSWEERVALYSIYTGQNMGAREGAVSLLWLEAYGVQAVEVSGPGSGEAYKPYVNPRKFDGLLPVLWRNGGDTIYQVPQRSASLAHVMDESQLVSVAGRPKDGLDTANLETYVAALNDPQMPAARFQWIGRSRARILASALPGQAISVQVSYDRGWHARAGAADVPITSDGLGLMVLHPRCSGPCAIDLVYDGGRELRMARWCRGFAILVCLGIVFLPGLRRRRLRTTCK